jgi:hypothetical protein
LVKAISVKGDDGLRESIYSIASMRDGGDGCGSYIKKLSTKSGLGFLI